MPPNGLQNGEKKHARAYTRIVPVIPRVYAKKSVDTTRPVKQPETALAPHPPAITGQVSNGAPANGEHDSAESDPVDITSISQPPLSGLSQEVVLADVASPSLTEDDHKTASPSSANPTLPTTAGLTTPESEPTALLSEPAVKGDHSAHKEPSSILDSGETPVKQSLSSADQKAAPVQLPPEFFPASRLPWTRPHDTDHGGQTFVFGGNVDSSATSPVPPASAGSWNSFSGHEQHHDSVLSPPPPHSNGFGKPPIPFGDSAVTDMASRDNVYSAASAPFYPQHHARNGSSYPTPREWQQQKSLQSHRSDSIGSNPSEHPQMQPPVQPYLNSTPPIPQNNSFHANNMTMPRAPPYQPHATVFHPHRGSEQFDPRFKAAIDYDYHNTQTLRHHTEDLFASEDFADCLLRVESSSMTGTVDIPAHSFILSRSPRLNALLRSGSQLQTVEINGRQCSVVRVFPAATFRDHDAFTTALRYLYGGNLMRRETLSNLLYSPPQALARALSYAAAGWYLQVPEIVTAGLSLAAELLVPENLDVALDFALRQDVAPVPGATMNGHGQAEPQPRPLYSPYALGFLQTITRFLVWPLTTSFEFDRTAPQLASIKRLPELPTHSPNMPSAHQKRKSLSAQKLHSIQLGDFQPHVPSSTTLSAILLSLPTHVLRPVVAHTPRPDLLRAIVAEREARRKALRDEWARLRDDERDAALAPDGPLSAAAVQATLESAEMLKEGDGGALRLVSVAEQQA